MLHEKNYTSESYVPSLENDRVEENRKDFGNIGGEEMKFARAHPLYSECLAYLHCIVESEPGKLEGFHPEALSQSQY